MARLPTVRMTVGGRRGSRSAVSVAGLSSMRVTVSIPSVRVPDDSECTK